MSRAVLRTTQAGSRYQRGLTLVELMIAMTIGMFITGMVSVLFLASNKTSSYQEATARMQENARFAMTALSRSIRNAGYRSCGTSSTLSNVVSGGTSTWAYNLETPVTGYEGGVSTFPAQIGSPIANTDALVLVGVDSVAETAVISHDIASLSFTTGAHSIRNGAVMVVSDCSNVTVFQNTGSNAPNQTRIFHGTSGVAPGNCFGGLGASCSKTERNHQFLPGATMSPLFSASYYIATSASGTGRSLWAVMLTDNGSVGAATEIIEGVDDMQLEYGEDTDGDGVPNGYVKANAVGVWANVSAIRVSLLMVTLKDNLSSTAQTYEFDGVSTTATDRRVRRAFTSVINLRNRVE